mmetsp:Transcript_61183/g.171149  ORF Transcript_61183/g.171149 Transcript_61183/m.171149 type:complete len:287 (+) Transcript_61183:14-874(+)
MAYENGCYWTRVFTAEGRVQTFCLEVECDRNIRHVGSRPGSIRATHQLEASPPAASTSWNGGRVDDSKWPTHEGSLGNLVRRPGDKMTFPMWSRCSLRWGITSNSDEPFGVTCNVANSATSNRGINLLGATPIRDRGRDVGGAPVKTSSATTPEFLLKLTGREVVRGPRGTPVAGLKATAKGPAATRGAALRGVDARCAENARFLLTIASRDLAAASVIIWRGVNARKWSGTQGASVDAIRFSLTTASFQKLSDCTMFIVLSAYLCGALAHQTHSAPAGAGTEIAA